MTLEYICIYRRAYFYCLDLLTLPLQPISDHITHFNYPFIHNQGVTLSLVCSSTDNTYCLKLPSVLVQFDLHIMFGLTYPVSAVYCPALELDHNILLLQTVVYLSQLVQCRLHLCLVYSSPIRYSFRSLICIQFGILMFNDVLLLKCVDSKQGICYLRLNDSFGCIPNKAYIQTLCMMMFTLLRLTIQMPSVSPIIIQASFPLS